MLKLSKREKLLLLVLVMMIFLWGYYRFIIDPQLIVLKMTKEKKLKYNADLEKVEILVLSEKIVKKQYDEKNNKYKTMVQGYFSHIDQPQIILLLQQFLNNSSLIIDSISFSPPRMEEFEDFQLEAMSVTLLFKGKYIDFISLINRVKQYDQKIIIENIEARVGEEGLLTGRLLLDFYSLSPIIKDKRDIFIFSGRGSTKNTDPFYNTAFPENHGNIDSENRYIYLKNDIIPLIKDRELVLSKQDSDSIDMGFENNRVLLSDFANNQAIKLFTSNPSVVSRIGKSSVSRLGKNAITLQYGFPPMDIDKYIHIQLEDLYLTLNQSPVQMTLWVYTDEISDQSIKARIKMKMGQFKDVVFTEKIDWLGWKKLITFLPQEDCLYPLQVEGIIINVPSYQGGRGNLTFESLEAIYPIDVIKEGSIENDGEFIYYEVQSGDTLSKISKTIYGHRDKQQFIKELNDIEEDKDLQPGKMLVIPKL